VTQSIGSRPDALAVGKIFTEEVADIPKLIVAEMLWERLGRRERFGIVARAVREVMAAAEAIGMDPRRSGGARGPEKELLRRDRPEEPMAFVRSAPLLAVPQMPTRHRPVDVDRIVRFSWLHVNHRSVSLREKLLEHVVHAVVIEIDARRGKLVIWKEGRRLGAAHVRARGEADDDAEYDGSGRTEHSIPRFSPIRGKSTVLLQRSESGTAGRQITAAALAT